MLSKNCELKNYYAEITFSLVSIFTTQNLATVILAAPQYGASQPFHTKTYTEALMAVREGGTSTEWRSRRISFGFLGNSIEGRAVSGSSYNRFIDSKNN